jgi:hypothetical protein
MDRAPFNRLNMATNLRKLPTCAKCHELQCSCRDDEWNGLPPCDEAKDSEAVTHRDDLSHPTLPEER